VWEIIIVVFIIAAFYWFLGTDSGRNFRKQVKLAEESKGAKPKAPPISRVGVKNSGRGTGLACPKCGGTQFKVGRKTSTKLLLGFASLLGQAKWVRCVTCGEQFRRG
jgi:hypothetical protein